MPGEILQTILIPRDSFTLQASEQWMADNNYPIKKIDIKGKYFRYRQIDPVEGAKYYSVKLSNGIILVFMY